jgi:hypothetical protein
VPVRQKGIGRLGVGVKVGWRQPQPRPSAPDQRLTSLLHCRETSETADGKEWATVVDEKLKVTNEINAETGQFDARFILWRTFCSDNDIPVETLPSDLTGESKDKWEKLKNERLNKPTEQQR